MKIIKIKKLVILFALLLAPVFAFAGCAAITNPSPPGYVSVLDNSHYRSTGEIGGKNFEPNVAWSNTNLYFGDNVCFYAGGRPGGASVYAEVENTSGVKGLHFAAFLNYYLNKIYCGSAGEKKATHKLFVNVVYYGPDVYPYTERGSVANGFGGLVKNYNVKRRGNAPHKYLIVVDFMYAGHEGIRLAINAESNFNQKKLKALLIEEAASQIVIPLKGNA